MDIKVGMLCLGLIGTLISCVEGMSEKAEGRVYQAISNRDTALLRLNLLNNEFYGTLIITRPGLAIDSGQVQGKVQADTLIGDYYYLPFQSAEMKRRPFLLLQKGDQYIKGTGMEKMYMGIPYYVPSTIRFSDPQFIFQQVR